MSSILSRLKIQVGLDRFTQLPSNAKKSFGRLGLVCNQASVSHDYTPAWQSIHEAFPQQLKALFGPQHGFASTVQDNMIETDHAIHQPTGLKVFSLYSQTREPLLHMLDEVDTLVVDLQISGTRVYTYKYTMAACLRAAKKFSKKIVVLDRPNPLGGVKVSGRVLAEDCRSFVGEFAIPMQHGLSMAELALFFNQQIQADLEIIKLENWQPELLWHEYNLPWVLTSPNIPIIDCLYTFPGTVMLEGTNISEGRGTCLPFLFVGAPYIQNPDLFVDTIIKHASHLKSLYLRPTEFMPAFQKWSGQICRGMQIHILDAHKFSPYYLGLAIIKSAIELAPKDFKWKEPGYEYNFKDPPIDLIIGSKNVDKHISKDLTDPFWSEGIQDFIAKTEGLLLYKRNRVVI